MNNVYLLLGGNLGNREANLQKAVSLIDDIIGKVILKSAVYKSPAWGNPNQPDFLNMALVCQSQLSPIQVLSKIFEIETLFKRVKTEKWGARTMDIDIIFYNNLVLNTNNLIIPHPLMQVRKFVLVPLLQIIPAYIHPVLKKSIANLHQQCVDDAIVVEI